MTRSIEVHWCSVCAAPFHPRLSALRRGEGRCCSRKCSTSLAIASSARNIAGKRHAAAVRTALYADGFPKDSRAPVAGRIVAKAITAGEIVRPLTCGVCGKSGRIEAHHEDYSQPLDVMWLCKSCHKKQHYKSASIRRAS